MTCDEIHQIVAAEIIETRRRLQDRIGGLFFVSLIVAADGCEGEPDAAHIDSQIQGSPDLPSDQWPVILEAALASILRRLADS